MTSDEADQVLWRVDGGVGWITLNRPEVRNAVTYAQRSRVMDLLDEAADRLDVRVVVLTGTGDSFCSGADLRAIPTRHPRPDGAPDRVALEVGRGIRTNAQRLVTTIMDCEKPVIAAVNGVAAGLGVQIALACDLVLAGTSARLIEVFSRRGLVPDGGGAYLLGRILGPHRAKELLFFGDDVSAEEAARLGLVNAVTDDDELIATASAWAARLAAGPTRTLAMTKLLVNRSLDMDRTSALAAEATLQDLNMTTADANEGIQSFMDRRPTVFRGW